MFVSMDGVWELRFPHCMFPVKTEVAGFPALNYPNVCTKEPPSQNCAFCAEHCEVARESNMNNSNLYAHIVVCKYI